MDIPYALYCECSMTASDRSPPGPSASSDAHDRQELRPLEWVARITAADRILF
ncbi:MAG: hypothetical protein GQ565_10720 [Candidatus Aegiribacteria sp.]|nr:hypothetical protein [Candidatus Aegiribacteria sp.]